MSELKKNQLYEALISGMTAEGSGVARLEGFAIFVPNSAVGDICEIKIVKLNKSYGFGRIERIITPSDSRIEVDCDKFEQCGGCTYRHISYEAELLIKQELVESAFKRIGDITASVDKIIPCEQQSRYRNKAQYPVGKNAAGEVASGFYAKRSHRIVSQYDCDLQPAFFSELKQAMLNFFIEHGTPIYDEETHKGLIRHIYLRYAQMTGEVMVCLVATADKIPQVEKLIELLTQKYSMIKSIAVNVNSEKTNVILGQKCKILFGEDFITDIICGIKVKISPLSFYQVNRSQAEVLYTKAIEAAALTKNDILLDLYCGTGTIGLSAANEVKRLTGVEIIPQAIENAKENARINGITNAEFICADAAVAAKNLVLEGNAPNVIIVDPPRKGLDTEVIDAIEKMSPDRLIMVSCNPSTAARDCKLLNEKGYEVKTITPIDMFPRTGHVECVVQLQRS